MPKLNIQKVPRALMAHRSTFTTITIDGNLRGCYGSFSPTQPLIADVAKYAYHSAFQDPRFKPMTMDDIRRADFSLSVLSIPSRFPVESEDDLINKIRPGKDGIVFRDKNKQGLFLPSVWESLPEPQDFVKGLKRKAGLPEDHWSDSVEIYRYTAEKIGPVPLVPQE